jgi:hypothetical protein
MDELTFQGNLDALMAELKTLPPDERVKLEALADETQKRHEQLCKSLQGLQESLDSLRLSVKYIVFDLEATRRENHCLRQMLENQSGEGN